jgi:hypothetical protein
VQIQKTDFGGKLTIDYFSVDDLEALLVRLAAQQAADAMAGTRAAFDAVSARADLTPPSIEHADLHNHLAILRDAISPEYADIPRSPEIVVTPPEPDESELYSVQKFTI